MEDKELIAQILSGNHDCFDQLAGRYEQPILRYLNRLLNFHRQDVDDCLNETFLKAYLNLAGYNSKLKFSSWLYRIAHNQAIDLIRKRKKIWSFDPQLPPLELHTKPAKQNDFENKDRLAKILEKLDLKSRNLLILFYFQQLSIAEISDILKISQGAVKTALSRAKNKAKKLST